MNVTAPPAPAGAVAAGGSASLVRSRGWLEDQTGGTGQSRGAPKGMCFGSSAGASSGESTGTCPEPSPRSQVTWTSGPWRGSAYLPLPSHRGQFFVSLLPARSDNDRAPHAGSQCGQERAWPNGRRAWSRCQNSRSAIAAAQKPRLLRRTSSGRPDGRGRAPLFASGATATRPPLCANSSCAKRPSGQPRRRCSCCCPRTPRRPDRWWWQLPVRLTCPRLVALGRRNGSAARRVRVALFRRAR